MISKIILTVYSRLRLPEANSPLPLPSVGWLRVGAGAVSLLQYGGGHSHCTQNLNIRADQTRISSDPPCRMDLDPETEPQGKVPRQPSLVTEEDLYLVVFMVLLVVDVVFSVADLGALLPM